MNVKTDLLYAGLSDTGRARRENEDRVHVDPERGLFLVADGLGGHAAGEHAAQTAVDMIAARLERKTGTPEERMREAIAVANNEIRNLAEQNPEWKGMACVVTVALIEDGQVTVGHVGDSRLYILEPGAIRKITSDHSPVGEMEDSGRLSESAAMAHPRRNEVFRDLGSDPHSPDDEDFIQVLRFPFRPSSALLLCSDGLSDQVTADQIRRLVEAYPYEPNLAVRALVNAANQAGGKDNVSVVLVEGHEYGAPLRRAVPPPVPEPPARASRRSFPILALLAGFFIAAALFAVVRPYLIETTHGLQVAYGTVRPARTWRVGPDALPAIADAMAQARRGDTILVEPGTYREEIQLRSGVALLSATRHAAKLEGDGVIVLADGVEHARIVGFRIAGPAAVGVCIRKSGLEVTDLEITGMRDAGIEVDEESQPLIRANRIVGNPGAGIVIRGAAKPIVTNNYIWGNGKTQGALRPGIQIAGAATPTITGNIIGDSGVEQIWASPLFNVDTLANDNLLAPGVKDRKHLIKVVTR